VLQKRDTPAHLGHHPVDLRAVDALHTSVPRDFAHHAAVAAAHLRGSAAEATAKAYTRRRHCRRTTSTRRSGPLSEQRGRCAIISCHSA
jgi:hypothetical protein